MMPNQQVEQRVSVLTTWVTAGLCFIVVFAISVMGILAWQAFRVGSNARQLREVATETHGALCALKHDQQSRHDAGVEYLHDHPRGVIAHGEVVISAAQIQKSLDGQESTIAALRGLDCS
jgi:hypothetical protein